MLMTTEMTTLHRTSPLSQHCTSSTLTRTSSESVHHESAVLFLVHISSHSHLAQVRSLSAPHPHVIHVSVVSLTRFTPLSTSQLSSCPSSSSPTYTSAKLLYQLGWWGHFRRPLLHHKIRWVKIVNTLLRWPKNDWDFRKIVCESAQSLRCSRRHEWRVRNPSQSNGATLWEGDGVPHSCQAWSGQKFLWTVMTHQMKIFYCNNMENELKSYHNKTNWANFVWMQDSWMLLKSVSILRRKILQNSHNSQIQWPVVSTVQFEEYALRLNASDFESRSKEKSKTTKDEILSAHPQLLHLLWRELGPILNQENFQSPILKCRRNWSIFFVMEAHFETIDGAIEFWRIKIILRNIFLYCHHWSQNKWKSSMAGEGGHKKRFQYYSASSRAILHLRALSRSFRTQFLMIALSHDNV